MKHLPYAGMAALFISVFFGLTPVSFASVTPTLQLSATGTGDAVAVTVTGDPNSSVLLSYTAVGSSGPQIASLGVTNGNGTFSLTVSSATYSLTSGTLVTALVGGTSGARSASVAWPAVSSASSLTLSQNALVIVAGSSTAITATNPGNGIYLSGNSNPTVVNVGISGTQITFSGNVAGSSTVTLCQVGNTSGCPTVFVTVEQAGSSLLTLSQVNPSVVVGQNLPITVSGGNGSYYIANNSNPSVIQASMSGSVLTVSTGATSGSSSITVCATDNAACGVVVASAGSASSAAVTLSTTAPSVAVGQSATVYVYGPTGVSFYVSSNSNPSAVQANLSGTTITLSGIAEGSSNISVCASSGSCANMTATITASAVASNIALSQSSVALSVGQNATVIVSGGQTPYSVSGGSTAISQQSLSGNSLSVYGIGGGSSSVNVCSAAGGCAILAVTVNGPAAASPSTTATTGTSTATPAASGTSSLSTSQVQSILSLIESFGADASTLANVRSALGGGQGLAAAAAAPAATPAASAKYSFTSFLHLTSRGTEVSELQKRLASLGYFSGAVTGYYGPLTQAAVKKFQAANGLTQAGYVGPGTRAALNR